MTDFITHLQHQRIALLEHRNIDDSRNEPKPVEIIFSCHVCNAILPDVYKDADLDLGFRDSDDRTHQEPVTRMWLGECTHFFCGKHLEGGGIPFHKKGTKPKAACPACVEARGDHSKKALFAVRGAKKGEYDERIPKNWFDTPPVTLTTEGKGMDAMRANKFHYISLIRFSGQMITRLRNAEKTTNDALRAASTEAEKSRAESQEVEGLRARVHELERCEKELQPWKEREPKIKHYLGIFTEVTRENEKLREQLTALGYAVPSRTYNIDPQTGQPNADAGHPNEPRPRASRAGGLRAELTQPEKASQAPRAEAQQEPRGETSSSRTLSGGPTVPIANLHTEGLTQGSISNRKRTREDDIGIEKTRPSKSPRHARGDSREIMPPPPKPFKKPVQLSERSQVAPQDHPNVVYPEWPSNTVKVRGEADGRQPHFQPTSQDLQPARSPKRPSSRDRMLSEPSRQEHEPAPPFSRRALVGPQQLDDYGDRHIISRHFTHAPQPQPQRKLPSGQRAFSSPFKTHAQNNGYDSHPPQRQMQGVQLQHPDLNQYVFQQTPKKPLLSAASPVVQRGFELPRSSSRRQPQYVPSTPSPVKQSMQHQQNHTSSVASPFFRRHATLQRGGRITLPETPFGAPGPSSASQMQYDDQVFRRPDMSMPSSSYAFPGHRRGATGFEPARANHFSQGPSLQPTTPSIRSNLPMSRMDGYAETRGHEHRPQQFSDYQNRGLLRPMQPNILANSGHRSGISKTSNEWWKERRVAPEPDMHLGHFLDSGRGGGINAGPSGRRSVRR